MEYFNWDWFDSVGLGLFKDLLEISKSVFAFIVILYFCLPNSELLLESSEKDNQKISVGAGSLCLL
jgi:hypothetical protein